jgi:DnaJ homolog subfamily C member 13
MCCRCHNRFLPEPVVLLLRSQAGNASLGALDESCENPELIWTKEMQGELRDAIIEKLGAVTEVKGGVISDAGFSNVPVLSPEYFVPYQQLTNELYVGGVYIRLYLKQPTFRLTNPVLFLEKLIEFWESAFSIQVPTTAKAVEDFGSSSDSRAVVLGNEDFLTLLTSCIICVIKGESSVLDHLLQWGFAHTLCQLLSRAVQNGRRGAPVTCIIRLLHQLVGRVSTVDNLASSPVDIIGTLVLVLDLDGCLKKEPGSKSRLPKEATFVVELLKKIFQSTLSQFLGHFVSMAMNAKLPFFILGEIAPCPSY